MDPLIEADSITVERDGRSVLHHSSFALMQGERLAIVGPNGAGKTTLLRSLVGLETVSHGQIRLFGQVCMREADFRQARQRIGFLFQDSDDQLFCPTVLEDVAFGPVNLGQSSEEATRTAEVTLEQLGLQHLADRLVHKLSGGEKRLICLAGLLAMKPDVLLLDEPTNGVDMENGKLLEQALLAFSNTMILVSHDDAFISRMATRGMMLRDGTLSDAMIHSHAHVHTHMHPIEAS
ncbi:ABC transporter ATP-binding protein [uncultured Cohaesibacter sp.]|uniref:energy-coupling factor ABC transporter ATP-binding protein n=1 Tax=uncultured Cohaesibacter sp. TaxID=1002546 RepID=UPI0029C78921|nr:ABC transporter ATP-binding protein [uncultured Cohaesibacter sp.]